MEVNGAFTSHVAIYRSDREEGIAMEILTTYVCESKIRQKEKMSLIPHSVPWGHPKSL